MFDLPAVTISSQERVGGGGLWLARWWRPWAWSAIFAWCGRGGLLVVLAVGGYITAAYWFTSSTSFANPAVTVARIFSDTFAGIAPGSWPCSSSCSCSAPLWATPLVRLLYPEVQALVAAGGRARGSSSEEPA